MSVIRGSSSDLARLQERMNLLFRQTLSQEGGAPPTTEGNGWIPAVDIQDGGDRTILRADLPGVVLEQIELRIEGDRLTLQGERRTEAGQSGAETHLRERPSGRFQRSFELPPNVDQGAIRAELRHGVLEVVLPKKPAIAIKPIKVEAR
jgi:HSP20 family protein